MPELPTLPREPTCPAALGIAGACPSQQGVVCRIMQQDSEDDAGLRMTPGQLEKVREAEGGIYLNLKSDPQTVFNFCHGSAVPVVTDADDQGRASYTYCPVWQGMRDRELAGERSLYDELEPEPVSMGLGEPTATHTAPDPFRAMRMGLDELAPPEAVSR